MLPHHKGCKAYLNKLLDVAHAINDTAHICQPTHNYHTLHPIYYLAQLIFFFFQKKSLNQTL